MEYSLKSLSLETINIAVSLLEQTSMIHKKGAYPFKEMYLLIQSNKEF